MIVSSSLGERERTHENEVGYLARHGVYRTRRRIDDHQLGMDGAGDVPQHFRLRVIGLNDENDAHEMTFSIRTTKTHAATRNVNR